jgi:hypothetical protein
MLRSIQQAIADVLKQDAVLRKAGVTVVVVDKGDALAVATEAVAGAGTAILIAPPSANFAPDSSAGPVADDRGIRVAVQVVESPVLSRAQGIPDAVTLAERIAWLLHAGNHPNRKDDTLFGVVSIRPVQDPELLVIEVTLTTTGSVEDPDAQEEGVES